MKKITVFLMFSLFVLLFLEGCFVKKESLKIPAYYKKAVELKRDKILDILKTKSEEVKTILIKTGKFRFIALSEKKGLKEKYPTVKGLLIADNKMDFRLQIFAPVVKSCVVDILQKGNNFKIWYPKKRTLYVGKSSTEIKVDSVIKENDKDLKYNLKNIRPLHIYETFFLKFNPESLKDVLVEEYDTKFHRYYLITVVGRDKNGNLIPQREYFLERSSLEVVRKKIFDNNGKIVEDINYYNFKKFGGISFPTYISLDRKMDGYRVEISIKKILLNHKLPSKSFILNLPEKYSKKILN